MDASCKKSLHMTSYGGIIRIRLKGRRCFLPLSLSSQAPLFLFDGIIARLRAICKMFTSADGQAVQILPENKEKQPFSFENDCS